jgi:threonine dehydratase
VPVGQRDEPTLISVADIEDAAHRLRGVLHATPLQRSATLTRLAGREVLVKPEHLQRTGSFKIRGAYNHISRLAEARPSAAVVTASAGNHAQGVALAAQLSQLPATIFMPVNAALPKIEATRGYGADVVLVGATVDDAMDAAEAHARAHDAVYVPPFDDPLVIAGQGTIGLEIIADTVAETVVVPVGGGGLIAGIATAVRALLPAAHVIGVEAAGATAMLSALRAGSPIQLASTATIADGISVRHVSALTLAHAAALVDEIVTVEEEEIARAVLFLLERSKWVVEPAGAVAIAALLAGKVPGSASTVAVISGGNVDPLLLTRLISYGLSAAGRFLTVRVTLADQPGTLSALTALLAALDLNVLAVEHQRSGGRVTLDEVEVLLTVETRDERHGEVVLGHLRDHGFRPEITG